MRPRRRGGIRKLLQHGFLAMGSALDPNTLGLCYSTWHGIRLQYILSALDGVSSSAGGGTSDDGGGRERQ